VVRAKGSQAGPDLPLRFVSAIFAASAPRDNLPRPRHEQATDHGRHAAIRASGASGAQVHWPPSFRSLRPDKSRRVSHRRSCRARACAGSDRSRYQTSGRTSRASQYWNPFGPHESIAAKPHAGRAECAAMLGGAAYCPGALAATGTARINGVGPSLWSPARTGPAIIARKATTAFRTLLGIANSPLEWSMQRPDARH
jgi:hypothetical protein